MKGSLKTKGRLSFHQNDNYADTLCMPRDMYEWEREKERERLEIV